jgi:hypothetical protein
VFSIGKPPVSVYRKGLQVQDSVHKLCGTEEDVLGPTLGALVRWVEVSKYKVCKRCYISFPFFPQYHLDQPSTDAERLIMTVTNAYPRWTTCP